MPFLFGEHATLVADPNNYVTGLAVRVAAGYALPPIGGAHRRPVDGHTALYGTGLDFSSLVPRLNRAQGTAWWHARARADLRGQFRRQHGRRVERLDSDRAADVVVMVILMIGYGSARLLPGRRLAGVQPW